MKNEAFNNKVEVQWCPGCPNYGILQTFKQVFNQMGKNPHEICLVSGIGQAAKLPHYLNCNFFNGLHGRAIPLALGIHATNPELTTIVVTGDGDGYGEGGNHLLHALRRNPDITIVVHNNAVYALTKGQAAPTTPKGATTTLPQRKAPYPPLDMLSVAISQNCGFVARGYAGDRETLAELLRRAIEHPGLSLVEIIQPCITWGDKPLKWYQDKIRPVDEDHNPADKTAALALGMDPEKRFNIGVLHESFKPAIFGEWFRNRHHADPLYTAPFMDALTAEKLLARYRHQQS